MEKDSESWFHHQHPHPLSPNLNLFGFPFDIGWLNTEPVRRDPYSVEDPTLRTGALLPLSGMQESKASLPNGSHSPNSFYCRPHFHQAFAPVLNSFDPVLNSASKQKFPAGTVDFGSKGSPIIGTAPAQKRFLVFDQSGDKTTLIYSSGVETPVQYGTYCVPKPPTTYNLIKEDPGLSLYPLRPNMNDEHIEDDNSRDIMEDEMHEDTEELNALLCSDSDSYFSEDEETSTGHSPSTMTDNGIRDLVEETGEEVDSFAGPTKRQKLLDGHYDLPSQRHSGSSLKTYACSALEDEAEPTCGNRQSVEELDSLSGGKRKERIWETVSILQSIFPNVNGKDAIVVIDEAIHYLRSLKVKAKALGLDTL